MGVVLGCFAAMLLLTVGCVVVSGILKGTHDVITAPAARSRTISDDDAKARALKSLSRHGVTKLAKGADVMEDFGGHITVDGRCRMANGDVESFRCAYEVTQFDDSIQWKVLGIWIDGQMVEGR